MGSNNITYMLFDMKWFYIFCVVQLNILIQIVLSYPSVLKYDFWMFLIADCEWNASRCCKCVWFLTVQIQYRKREHVVLKILVLIFRLIQPFLQCLDVLLNFNHNLDLIAVVANQTL